jgi:hypothetical protein
MSMGLWRAALITLAALAALGVLAAAVGLLLPRGHVETRSRVFGAAPETVFAAIARVEPPYEIVEQAPPHRLVSRVADPGLPYGGTWTFELAPEGGGTRLTITERGEVHNPVFRVLARFVFGYAATMEAYLEDLAARLR